MAGQKGTVIHGSSAAGSMTITSFRRHTAPQLAGEKDRKRERYRGSRQERGYDADWERLRDRYKKHVNGICEECARRGYLALGDDVDHVIPIRDDPDLRLEWTNLQMLCWQHHKGWKAKIEDYARKIGAIRMLPQWCRNPETRPAHFQVHKMGPMRGLLDGIHSEGGEI